MFGRLPFSTQPFATLPDQDILPASQQLRARDLSAPMLSVTDESQGTP
jgi:hypothetical protein